MAETPPRLSDADFEKLTEHIERLLKNVEDLPLPKVREDIFELLNCLDFLHREALTRLVELIEAKAPQLKRHMANDFAIQTLMMLYSFVPEEPESPSPASHSVFIPVDQISVSPSIQQPIWLPAGNSADIPPGAFRAKKFEDIDVLLCNIDGKIFALRNACLDSILPLSSGRLEGYILVCPWHQCRYDVRTGEIQNGSGLKLETYPVRISDDGRLQVGFNIPKWELKN